MQERKASIGGIDHPMKDPFFVLATQNPIEQEGTYPLPEAQLDRFLFLIKVDYPTAAEEEQIMRQGDVGRASRASRKVLHGDDILALQHIVRRVPVSDHVFQFAKRITRMSRPGTPEAADFVNKWLTWGAGPRASMNLILAAKAHADPAGQQPRVRRRRRRRRRADPAAPAHLELHRPERRHHGRGRDQAAGEDAACRRTWRRSRRPVGLTRARRARDA